MCAQECSESERQIFRGREFLRVGAAMAKAQSSKMVEEQGNTGKTQAWLADPHSVKRGFW